LAEAGETAMTVVIDCRHIDSSGIGVYLRGLLPFLLNSENNFLLLGEKKRLEIFFQESKNVIIIDCAIKPFSLRELLFFPKHLLQKINSSDVFYSPYFNIPCGIRIPVFTTIHDIIFPDMPELVSKIGLKARMFFFRRAYKKSQKIFTVSEFSKSRIEHHLGKEKPVIVTHLAILPQFLEFGKHTENIQKKETIVFIRKIKKHKGLDYLLDAFLLAKKGGLPHKLLIIGSRENFRTTDNAVLQKIDSFGCEAVAFTGFVSDRQLMEHLSSAALLVQPSLYEGFGIPPLEAMVLGTRVLISDIPVFREIYADFPVTFFRAGDTEDLKEKMIDIIVNQTVKTVSLPENLLSKYTSQKTSSIILRNITTMKTEENHA
jgi:glycosyltransferase involved in cell wall biosynthesis